MPNDMTDQERLCLAEKLSYFMVGVQSFYEHDLGLEYVDADPRPGTSAELPLRISYLEKAQERGRTYHLAHRLHQGVPSQSVDAIRALLITNDLGQLESGNKGIEIFEFDVAQSDRNTGLGRALLRYAFADVEPTATVALSVAENNTVARRIYHNYGFEVAGAAEHHGVFDVGHIPMATKANTLQQRLGLQEQA